ncbi:MULTISPECIES: hypothetical protein [unclassified Brevundimonas]|uniref:hypothetical protein n=1 Tax=unclassified Brevundimonas TaxID=2622653 RepID=UPI0025B9662A|nr:MULTISPECIES: hypothetical protein [unclassified Brevundimonas]
MLIVLSAALLFAGSDPAPPPPISAPAAATQAPAASTSPAIQPLDLAELHDLNGRQGVVVVIASDQLLKATNSGNSVNANSVGSGGITFAGGAFAGYNGIGNFVMNTGHNNNLQGAITINIVTTGPTP